MADSELAIVIGGAREDWPGGGPPHPDAARAHPGAERHALVSGPSSVPTATRSGSGSGRRPSAGCPRRRPRAAAAAWSTPSSSGSPCRCRCKARRLGVRTSRRPRRASRRRRPTARLLGWREPRCVGRARRRARTGCLHARPELGSWNWSGSNIGSTYLSLFTRLPARRRKMPTGA